ncbi:uncharacterized protein LOC114359656 [Ostrinia furnacalis]|uniref:uncharacterized protein LOC114359656 n=1 Tax=Ostrinia furnacalis TaxID=93504 RepID=UPI00103E31FE|nr:uncharacterized protein LOC114359656 [Ostrinia furnacalis]
MVAVQNDANGPEDGGGARFRPEPSSYLMTFMDIVNMITHMTLGAVAFITIFLGIMYVPVLRQHIILTVVGYVILMTQSILVLSSHNGWSRTIRYKDRKIVHLLMQVFGSILAIAGNIVVMVEKNELQHHTWYFRLSSDDIHHNKFGWRGFPSLHPLHASCDLSSPLHHRGIDYDHRLPGPDIWH